MRLRTSSLVLVAAIASTTVAHAQPSKVSTARQLAIQGIEAVEGGDCDKGLPLLERAESLHHATVHLQYMSRCHVEAGRFVAATELWRQIVREGAPTGASPAVHAAVAEANRELPKYLPKLGTTTIRTASTYENLEVTLDGAAIPAEMVNAPHVMDPGDHELVAKAPGFSPQTQTWTVDSGEQNEIVIELEPGPGGGAAGIPDTGAADSGTSTLQTVGWITGAAGVAVLVGGTVTFLTRNNRRSNFEDDCPREGGFNVCRQPEYDQEKLESEKSSIETLTTVSNVLFVAGGALLATGVTLVVVGASSSERPAPSARLSVSPTVGGAAMGFGGRF